MGRHSISNDAADTGQLPHQPEEGKVSRRSVSARWHENTDTNQPSTAAAQQVELETQVEDVPSAILPEDDPFTEVIVGKENEDSSPSSAPKKPSLLIRIIGVIGEIFITLGVVMGLFIVWQVWWTDILANREQAERLQSVSQDWTPPSNGIGAPRYDEPPKVAHDTTMGAFQGVMRIPAFGKDYKHTIEYGVGLEEVLDKGAFGHYDDTAWPGEVGNYALAAHRQTYGAPMKHVDKLSAGSPIVVETKDAYLVYYVTESYITTPSDTGVIAPVPNHPEVAATDRLMTITTCHPPFVSNERWIIHAKFDHWVSRADGVPKELAEEK